MVHWVGGEAVESGLAHTVLQICFTAPHVYLHSEHWGAWQGAAGRGAAE